MDLSLCWRLGGREWAYTAAGLSSDAFSFTIMYFSVDVLYTVVSRSVGSGERQSFIVLVAIDPGCG